MCERVCACVLERECVYVCMCLHVCVCVCTIFCTSPATCVVPLPVAALVEGRDLCARVCVRGCVCVCARACVYVYEYVCTYASTGVHNFGFVGGGGWATGTFRMYNINIYMICIYVNMYVRINICMYIRIYICSWVGLGSREYICIPILMYI